MSFRCPRPFLTASIALCTVVGLSCAGTRTRSPEPERPGSLATDDGAVDSVILLIGDGFGPQQLGLLLSYARQVRDPGAMGRATAFDRLVDAGGEVGFSLPFAADALVADSGSTATQLGSGRLAGIEMIGADRVGNPVESLVEAARAEGKATGIVTDMRVTHATPAAFGAKEPHRSREGEIAVDLVETAPDVLLGGGLSWFLPASAKTRPDVRARFEARTGGRIPIEPRRQDERDLLREAEEKGYDLAFDRAGLERASRPVLGLFASSETPDRFGEEVLDGPRDPPRLAEMTARALALLEDDPDGFFLVVEAGQIDSAGHRNDAGWMLREMFKMNEVLDLLVSWVRERERVLLLVTGDHETGGFGFTYSRLDLPEPVELPGAVFDGHEFLPRYNFAPTGILDRLAAQKRSYSAMVKELDALPESERGPEALAAIVRRDTGMVLPIPVAIQILEQVDGVVPSHDRRRSGAREFPDLGGAYDAYWVYRGDNRAVLLARALAVDNNVSWSTGTHTSTPVPIFALGPPSRTREFGGLLHHTDIGRLALEALRSRR